MMANGRIRPLWPVLISVLLALFATGCSNSTENGGLSLVDEQGNHPANFLSTHPAFAVSSVAQCRSCHGNELAGGIANTSCFTAACHHGTIPGWASPAEHGASAKRAPGHSGFKSCQICHGVDFSGDGAVVACADCHIVNAPHPAAPWHASGGSNHATTDPANASVCAACHFPGSTNNPAGHPATPAPAGTSPGCFNSTLCHGENLVPHPLGGSWVTTPPAAQPHGNDAKATPSSSAGFAYCRVCHGTSNGNYNGGIAQVSCLNVACHGGTGNSPHASQWFQGDTYEHITTDEGNASECAFCHFNEPNAGNHPPTPPPGGSNPGCFNGTLCHGAGLSQHSAGWFVRFPPPQPHGQSAKAPPSGSSGFAYCRVCHGTSDGNFNGGAVQFSCRIVECHGGAGLSPHAAQWLPGDTYEHITTDEGNAPECGFCHYGESGGGNHSPTPPPPGSGCFNDTLCHGS
ncbi:MAG: hypothetical protein WBA34_11215 [Candidatus Deferrimicrobiaceae bacterium]